MYRKKIDLLRHIVFETFVGRLLLIPLRFFNASKEGFAIWKKIIKYTFISKEFDNFTYDLTDINKDHLCNYLSCITGISSNTVKRYIDEVEKNSSLRSHLNNRIDNTSLKYCTDKNMFYGRRLAWYALVRITKPKLIIETGVDKGLGACIITAALMKNAREGDKGRYIGLDINPMSGKLFSPPYTDYGDFICIDSHKFLKKITQPIDIFIHDSDHSYAFESKEYEFIKNKLSRKAYIVSDNSRLSTALSTFAAKMNKRFLLFKEETINHWYTGEGIGIVW